MQPSSIDLKSLSFKEIVDMTTEQIVKPEGVVRQLNFDDVYGTNYGFDKMESVEVEDNVQSDEPTDYEMFVKMLTKAQFTHGFEERKGVMQVTEMGDHFDVNTKEIVLVQSDGLRTVAMFCESDESLLGFITENIAPKIRHK